MAMLLNTLRGLTKEELSNMVLEYQNKFYKTEHTSLRDRFTKMKNQLFVTRRVKDNLWKQNCILDRQCATNEQYSWRECLEISGMPDSVSNNNLQETVLKTLSKTGVTVDSRDVEACH